MDAGKTKAIMNKKLGFFLTKPKILIYGIVIGLVAGIVGIIKPFSCRRAAVSPSEHA